MKTHARVVVIGGGVVRAIRHPGDGYVQPADLTQALATGARRRGAALYRNTTVTAITRTAGGEWRVHTDRGDIVCEHVVSATGSFARRTGAMVGLDIPVIPVQHQYIVTEPHPEIQARHAAGLAEMGVLRESDGSWYLREERGGLILGPYEAGAPACYVDGPAEDCEYELFQEDLERLEPHIEAAIRRVPAFGEVGVKQVFNGAICYTPDGSPVIGPAWGLDNFWLNEGHSFGITAAGGAGLQLAEWMVEGEPGIDMLGVDPRRIGDYATRAYLVKKNEEACVNVFTVHYPDEERPAARETMIAGVRIVQRHHGPAGLGRVSRAGARPGRGCPDRRGPRDLAPLRPMTTFHPVGTCKMGVMAQSAGRSQAAGYGHRQEPGCARLRAGKARPQVATRCGQFGRPFAWWNRMAGRWFAPEGAIASIAIRTSAEPSPLPASRVTTWREALGAVS